MIELCTLLTCHSMTQLHIRFVGSRCLSYVDRCSALMLLRYMSRDVLICVQCRCYVGTVLRTMYLYCSEVLSAYAVSDAPACAYIASADASAVMFAPMQMLFTVMVSQGICSVQNQHNSQDWQKGLSSSSSSEINSCSGCNHAIWSVLVKQLAWCLFSSCQAGPKMWSSGTT
jgi:hypothetical protein